MYYSTTNYMLKKDSYILYGASFNPPHMGHFDAICQMLDTYDKVIVFPYPHKHESGRIEKILPLKHRMTMLGLFLKEFFPQIHDRLILVNLSSEIKLKDKVHEGVYHTYDYLKLVQEIYPNVKIGVCLGTDAQISLKKQQFTNEEQIKKEFNIFTLEEKENFNSRNIREFFQKKKVISSKKDADFLRYCLGSSLTNYILKNELYNLSLKKVVYEPVKEIKTSSNEATSYKKKIKL